MVNIERLTPDGWKSSATQSDIHAAVTYAKELCMEEPSTYRVLRNNDLGTGAQSANGIRSTTRVASPALARSQVPILPVMACLHDPDDKEWKGCDACKNAVKVAQEMFEAGG